MSRRLTTFLEGKSIKDTVWRLKSKKHEDRDDCVFVTAINCSVTSKEEADHSGYVPVTHLEEHEATGRDKCYLLQEISTKFRGRIIDFKVGSDWTSVYFTIKVATSDDLTNGYPTFNSSSTDNGELLSQR